MLQQHKPIPQLNLVTFYLFQFPLASFSKSELVQHHASAYRGPQCDNRRYQITSPRPSRSLSFLPRSERSMSDTWQFISLYSLHCILTEVMLHIEASCHGNLVVHSSWMFCLSLLFFFNFISLKFFTLLH